MVNESARRDGTKVSLPIALELYTVRDQTAIDFPGTLARVAEMGYRAVEFAGYGGLPAGELAGLLKENGLQTAATHVSLEKLRASIDAEIEYCHAISCQYLVLPGLPEIDRQMDRRPALLAEMERFGRSCRAANITFGYHNHAHEFLAGDGPPLMDAILQNTDPELVALELDVYWAAHAGSDPIEFLRSHADRVKLLHLKDMAPDGGFAEVGDGSLNLGAIVELAPSIGVRWGIVENDAPKIPSLESARRSLTNLQAMVRG